MDASLVAAPSSATPNREGRDQGRSASREWKDKPVKPAPEGSRCALDGEVHESQARRAWHVPAGRSRYSAFGYDNDISIYCRVGLIRTGLARDAVAYEAPGCARACSTRRAPQVASGLTRHIAPRPMTFHGHNGFASQSTARSPGQGHAGAMRRANNIKSKVRSRVEHVSPNRNRAWTGSSGPSASRALGPRSAHANLVYNIKRRIFLNE